MYRTWMGCSEMVEFVWKWGGCFFVKIESSTWIVNESFLVFLIVLQGCETCGLLAFQHISHTVDQKKSQGQPHNRCEKKTPCQIMGYINKNYQPTSTGFFCSNFFQTCEIFWLRWEHLPMIRRRMASWVSTMLWTQRRFGAIALVFGRI